MVHHIRVAGRKGGQRRSRKLPLKADVSVRKSKRPPVHPGEILREDVLPALGVTVAQAARDLGVSRQLLHGILSAARPITPAMAVRLGRYCGNGPQLWLNLQVNHDLWFAERDMAQELLRIPRLPSG
jgi:antitoxin HigA-1